MKALDEESELMEDWREKYSILKSGMDAADEKVAQGKKAESPEEIESCYIMLKVRVNSSYLIIERNTKIIDAKAKPVP